MPIHHPHIIACKWHRWSTGYGIDRDGAFYPCSGGEWIVYDAHEASPKGAIHREFAGLAYVPMGSDFAAKACAFANSYGLLGFGSQEETLTAWRLEAQRLAPILELIAIERGGSLDAMNRIVARQMRRLRVAVERLNAATGADSLAAARSVYFDPEALRIAPAKDRAEARRRLRELVSASVNEVLSQRNADHPAADSQPIVVTVGGGPALGAYANTLLGFLWLELAASLSTDTAVEKTCKRCGTLFVVDRLNLRRKSREYCSDRCRNAQHEQRVREAKALKGQGLTDAEVAKRLGTKAATVRGWTRKRRTSKGSK